MNVLSGGLTTVAVILVVVPSIPVLLGYHLLLVAGGSMSPSFEPGDALLVRPEAATSIDVGDAIAFLPTPGGRITTHRVIAVRQHHGEIYFQTQGDANDSVDPDLESAGTVIGVVRHRIPVPGRWLHAVTTPQARAALIGIPALLLALQQGAAFARALADRQRKKQPGTRALSAAIVVLVVGALGGLGTPSNTLLSDEGLVSQNAFSTASFP